MAHDVWDTDPEYWSSGSVVRCYVQPTCALNHAEAVRLAEERQAQLRPGWYAQSRRYETRMGPFASDGVARGAMKLNPRTRAEQKVETGSDYPYPIDMVIWKEGP